jgi:hypothetical protein
MKSILSIIALAVLPLAAQTQPVKTEYKVTLTWQPNTEADLGGYKMYIGPASNTWTHVKPLGLVTETELTLPGPGTWFITLTATNLAGLESEPSNIVSYTTAGGPPGKPLQFISLGGTVTQIINLTNLIVIP